MIRDLPRLDPRRIARTLDDIAQIGNRYAGSDGEARARDYLQERLRELGLPARLEPVRYLRATPADATCQVGGEGAIACHPLQYTAPGAVSGAGVYLGEATDADLERMDARGVDLRGRVVVAHSMFPFDLRDRLTERGVAGLVHICETPDGIVGNFAGALYPPVSGPLPYAGVTIGHPDGRALISSLSAGRPVEITLGHVATCEEASAANVVSEIPDADASAGGHVIVCAHYDTQAEGPGVYDNGTGVAALLECARVLAQTPRRLRVVILASAVEELGCWGATAYTREHAADLRDATAMVNLDGVASAYPSQREIWSAAPALADLAARTARDMGWVPDRVARRRSTFGDHAPFGDAGVPSCLIWRPEHPYYHSRGDVRALVDASAVALTAEVSLSLIDRLAQGFPVSEPVPGPG